MPQYVKISSIRKKETEDIPEIIMDKSLPKLMTDNKSQIQEALKKPSRINIKNV